MRPNNTFITTQGIENHPKAEWCSRLGAYLLDAIAAAIVGLVVYAVSGSSKVGITVFEVFFFVNFFIGWKRNGQTIGMMPLKIRVVTQDGNQLGWGRTLWRYIAFTLSLFSLIGMVWIIFDKQKQGLHDKLAGTYVIKMR